MKTPLTRGALRAAFALLATLTPATLVFGATGEVSFTPTGFKVSIMKIALSAQSEGGAPTSEQVLYTCPGATEAECLVDVTNQAELDAITAQAASVAVQVGSYDTISLNMCAPGSGGTTRAPGFIRGAFVVPSEGKTYATVGDDASVTGLKEVSDLADAGAEFTAIGNWSCNTKTVLLRTPVVVADKQIAPLTVVVDAKVIAFSTSHVSPGMGGCRGYSDGQGRGLCVSYPSIFPLVSDDDPELDRFLVAHHRTDADAIDDTKANAYVVVARRADGGDPLTAFVRPFFSETSAAITQSQIMDPVFGGPAYMGETNVPSFHQVGDASVSFITGGSLDEGAIFHDFQLRDHKGTVDTYDAGSWQYHAAPLVP
jgi:hypothetical protein